MRSLVNAGLAACAVIALASLGGCGGRPAAADPSAVAKAEMPKLKTGKWVVRSNKDGVRSEPDEMCISDSSVEKLANSAPMLAKSCTSNTVGLEDGVVVAHSYCKDGKSRITTTIRITGDFKTKYQMEARQVYSPATKKKSQSMTVLSAERIGDC